MEYVAVPVLLLVAVIAYRRVWRRADGGQGPVVCNVETLETGWVELRGRVRAVSSLRSPLSGRSVVGYAVHVDEERGMTAWETVIDLCRVLDFELEDESGRVLVRASRSLVQLDTGVAKGRGGPFRALPRRVVSLLHRHGRPIAGVLFGRAFRWRERVLEEGQCVRLRGWVAESESSPELRPSTRGIGATYRDLPIHLTVIGGADCPVHLRLDD